MVMTTYKRTLKIILAMKVISRWNKSWADFQEDWKNNFTNPMPPPPPDAFTNLSSLFFIVNKSLNLMEVVCLASRGGATPADFKTYSSCKSYIGLSSS